MTSSARKIFDLDDKVLCHVLSYLKLEDKLKLALLNTDRFKNLAKIIISSDEYFDIADIFLDFTLKEANTLLCNYGHFFKKFRFVSSFDDEKIMEFFSQLTLHTLNLEEIFLSGFDITVTNAHGLLLDSSKQLKILRLKNCTLGNKAGWLISKLLDIEVLELEDSKLTGKGLNKLVKLVDLSLKKCRNFKCGNLIEICKATQLKRLNIVGFKQLSFGAIKVLLESQHRLEVLILGNTYWAKDFSKICLLKNLREVSILARDEEVVFNYLKELVTEHKETLQCLEIYLHNVFLNCKEYLMQMANQISRFDNLKVLSFRNCSLFEDPHLTLIGNSLKHLEMLDLSGTSFTDVGILGCVECCLNLRYLNISHCKTKNSLYFKLVCVRKELGACHRLMLFLNSGHPLTSLTKHKDHKDLSMYVTISTIQGSQKNEGRLLDHLHELNAKYNDANNKPIKQIIQNSTHEIQEENTIFQLGENCLYHIFEYLSVLDKFTLVLTNQAFCGIVKYFLRTELVDIVQTMSNFTLKQTRKILSRVGPMIKRLRVSASIYHYSPDYFDLFAEHCNNLEEIHCFVGIAEKLAKTCTSLIMSSANTLKIIRMNHWDTQDRDFYAVSRVKHLHTLLLKSPRVTGLHFDRLHNLRVLELSDCAQLLPRHFIEICRSNRLIKLGIRGCRNLDSESFQVLAETQCELKCLIIGGAYAATNISVLAHLISINDISLLELAASNTHSLLDSLSKLKRDQVESLTIECRNDLSGVCLNEIKEYILNFSNLLYLRLQSNDLVNNGYMKKVIVTSPNLRILNIQDANYLDNMGILAAVKCLYDLRYLEVKFCDLVDAPSLYRDIVEIKRCRDDIFPLVLEIRSRDDNLDDLPVTKEYKVMEKYVKLPVDSMSNANKHEYLKPRRKRRDQFYVELNSTFQTYEKSILNLPSSCLLKIASYLSSVDQLKLIFIHNRFSVSIQPIIKNILFDLNEISENFTLHEANILFTRCGNDIRRIKYSVLPRNNPIAYLEPIVPYKNYFTEIYLDNSYHMWSWEGVKLFSLRTQRLEKIILRDYYTLEPMIAEIEVNGGPLNSLKNLTEMHLTDCYPVQTLDFIFICSNSKLKILDIRGCSQLQNEAFVQLVACQGETLEWLGMSCDYEADNYSDVAYLANLQHIVIECYSNVSQLELLLDKLVKARRNDLRCLEIQNIKDTNRVFDYDLIYRIVEYRRRKFSKLHEILISQAGPYVKPYHY